MNTQDYILNKYGLAFDAATRLPIELPNISRDDLAALFAELGYNTGVEIGVREGDYSEALCKANPQLKLYGVDPYRAYSGYRDHIQGEPFDAYYEKAQARLAPYNYEFIKKFSLDAVKDFEDQSLDFVYIDGNHDFKNCTNDIVEWSKKVKYGGIISGHDYIRYRRPTNMHCFEVVNGYTASYDIKPWFITSSKIVRDDTITVEARSWLWVNQPFPAIKGSRE